ncbi:hypothetical protein J6590_038639 [Homalodisca vitripennis]|nr:hypothetical protein J6590_038639 [Homalodisca vitripennis]
MEFNPSDIRKLAQLLKSEGEDSSSDDDVPKPSKLGPGDIKSKSQVKIRVPTEEYEHSYYTKKKTDPKSIWEVDEVPIVAFCDDASYDPRQRPEFDIKYRQAVTSEDLFLQIGCFGQFYRSSITSHFLGVMGVRWRDITWPSEYIFLDPPKLSMALTSGWSVVSEHLKSQDRHFHVTCFCEWCKPKMQRSLEKRFDIIKQAYPDVALARSGVFRPCWKTFDFDNVTRARKVLNSDRRLSIRLIAQMLHLPKSVVHEIVTEHSNMHKVAHWRPEIAAHTAFLVNSYLTKAGIPTLPQPPYSPHFETTEGIQAACTAALKAIPENAFCDAFNAWKSRWQRCIDAEGADF